MEWYILDTDFRRMVSIDKVESKIWTDRFQECGDFEITVPLTVTDKIYDFQRDYYIQNDASEHMMIIESLEIDVDSEDGNTLIIKGRSLESILDRRIIWEQTIITGNLQSAIKKLVTDAIINPKLSDRKIDNFIFVDSTDEAITSLELDSAQYTGDNLYEVVCSLCKEFGIGFQIILNDNNIFEMSLYSGQYRTYDQLKNPPVIFSPEFENIINSSYVETSEGLKTVTLVAGEGEGVERKTATVGGGGGIFRREMFTDARDISSKTQDDVQLTPAEYTALLEQRGIEKLFENNNQIQKLIDGELETSRTFQINQDFFLGDIVQFRDYYHNEADVRITEVIYTEDNTGETIYPTFDYIVDYNYLLAESEDIILTQNHNEIEIDL